MYVEFRGWGLEIRFWICVTLGGFKRILCIDFGVLKSCLFIKRDLEKFFLLV